MTISGTPGPSTLTMLPRTTENLYLVDGTLTVFDVPANATLGDTVEGLSRTVPASGAPKILARIRAPALFGHASEGVRMASLPPAVRAQFDIELDWFPPLTPIFVLRDGIVWIRPRPATSETAARWDMFSSNGDQLDRAQLP